MQRYVTVWEAMELFTVNVVPLRLHPIAAGVVTVASEQMQECMLAAIVTVASPEPLVATLPHLVPLAPKLLHRYSAAVIIPVAAALPLPSTQNAEEVPYTSKQKVELTAVAFFL